MKVDWGSGSIAHAFLTSALDGDEWSSSRPGHLNHRERAPGTHWIGGWVASGVSLTITHNNMVQYDIQTSVIIKLIIALLAYCIQF
jgi:hypothetical protein